MMQINNIAWICKAHVGILVLNERYSLLPNLMVLILSTSDGWKAKQTPAIWTYDEEVKHQPLQWPH